MAEDGAAKDALVHTSAVYLYQYDTKAGQYVQQGDAVVGCALLASSASEFKLLFYHSQTKEPLVTTAVTPATRFTPQQNHYVNFYDAAQQNYSMRFKDAAASAAFLRAVAFAKAQAFVQDPASYRDASRSHIALFDDLEMGKESSSGGVGAGDVVGLAWTSWQGLTATNASFFTKNPLEITQKTPNESIERDGDLKRVVLGDSNNDALYKALTDALQGMQKHGRRLVSVVFPAAQQWFIGDIELVKVKKSKGGSITQQQQEVTLASAAAPAGAGAGGEDDSSHDDLVHRMAALSRAGSSRGSGLIASINARSPEKGLRRQFSSGPSLHDAISNAGMVPVPLPGIVMTPDNRGSTSRRQSQQPLSSIPEPQGQAAQPSRDSVTARVMSTAYHPPDPVSFNPTPSSLDSSSYRTPEMESLMKEQSELDDLRRKLEESKRRLEQQHSEPSTPPTAPSPAPPAAPTYSNALAITVPPFTPSSSVGLSNGFTPWQPTPSSPPSSSMPPSFTSSFSSSLPSAGRSGIPSYNNSSSLIPTSIPTSTPSSLSSYTSRPPQANGSTLSVSPELETSIMRLQRSSTSVESTLQDLQSKMDRLLNMQNSMKTSKYTPMASSGGFYSSSLGSSSSSASSSTSSSSSLLKSLEKALAQRDQLQDHNARLQDARDQMESTIEDLQNQHESLQLENRNLLEKLQNGNHLQQDKFRLELRTVQQQLSHTQEQMLVYQEENFRLRQELAAKDEQVTKEKSLVQEDARKQLDQLQRQLQLQVHQESKETLERLQAEKLRVDKQLSELSSQKSQIEIERDSLANQVRVLQSQQSQWADEKAQVQSMQDSRAKELHAQLQSAGVEMANLKQLLDKSRSETRQLQDVVASKEQEMAELQEAKTQQEYAALSELLKEFMNDIYFHFQDAFEEDAEFTGKEIVMAIRKILKQNTMEILSKLEEFWQQQHRNDAA